MKNISSDIIKNYNCFLKTSNYSLETSNTYNLEAFEKDKEFMLHFFKATVTRLKTDLTDMEKLKSKDCTNERNRFLELIKIVNELEIIVTGNSILDTSAIANIEVLNRYNIVKNKQIKIIAFASVILTVIAVIFSFVNMS